MSQSIHSGIHARRLNDGGLASARERAFAEQWQNEQAHDLLAYLLGQDNQMAEFTKCAGSLGVQPEVKSAGRDCDLI